MHKTDEGLLIDNETLEIGKNVLIVVYVNQAELLNV